MTTENNEEEGEEKEEEEEKEETKEKVVKISKYSIPIVPFLLGIIIVLGISVGVLMNKTCPEGSSSMDLGVCNNPDNVITSTTIGKLNCPPCEESGDSLMVIYLMPQNCTKCDISMIEKISSDIRVKIQKYITDSVQDPMVLVGTDKFATLATANTRYNIINAICEFTRNKRACDLKALEGGTIKDKINYNNDLSTCLEKNNVSMNDVIFYHTKTCIHCKNMEPFVEELTNKGYKFFSIDANDKKENQIAIDCLPKVLDPRGYVPQFGCPKTGDLKIGEFPSIEKMEEFVKACNSSA